MESHFRYEERVLLGVLKTVKLDAPPGTCSGRWDAATSGWSRRSRSDRHET